MTIDERIEFLVQSIERLIKFGESQNERISKLLDIAENHERRLQRLEHGGRLQ